MEELTPNNWEICTEAKSLENGTSGYLSTTVYFVVCSCDMPKGTITSVSHVEDPL